MYNMGFRGVFIEKDSFKTLIASAIEVYSRETSGMLLGNNATREIDGVKKKVVSINDVYPIQTEKRKRSEVSHGNIAAINRLMRVTKSLRTNIIGGYHSHPHPYESNVLSRGDVDFIKEELKAVSKVGHKRVDKGWLELLMSITKRNYGRQSKSKWYTCSYVKKVRCRIRTQKRTGYDVMVSAYWVYPKKKEGKEYDVKEVPVHVPWIAE